MPQKLETIMKNVEEISNNVNSQLIKDYHRYLIARDTGTNYQKDNIKLIHMFAKFIGEFKTFSDVKDSETIVTFLDTRRKNKEDPEQNHMEDNNISDPLLGHYPLYKILEFSFFNKLPIHNLHMVFKIKGFYAFLSNHKELKDVYNP
jgi:hypothetical protein